MLFQTTATSHNGKGWKDNPHSHLVPALPWSMLHHWEDLAIQASALRHTSSKLLPPFIFLPSTSLIDGWIPNGLRLHSNGCNSHLFLSKHCFSPWGNKTEIMWRVYKDIKWGSRLKIQHFSSWQNHQTVVSWSCHAHALRVTRAMKCKGRERYAHRDNPPSPKWWPSVLFELLCGWLEMEFQVLKDCLPPC